MLGVTNFDKKNLGVQFRWLCISNKRRHTVLFYRIKIQHKNCLKFNSIFISLSTICDMKYIIWPFEKSHQWSLYTPGDRKTILIIRYRIPQRKTKYITKFYIRTFSTLLSNYLIIMEKKIIIFTIWQHGTHISTYL